MAAAVAVVHVCISIILKLAVIEGLELAVVGWLMPISISVGWWCSTLQVGVTYYSLCVVVVRTLLIEFVCCFQI